MPRARKKDFYEVVCCFTIFAFADHETGEIFVWKTKNPNLKRVFERHYFLYNACTKEMFRRGKEQGKPPEMYILEIIQETEAVAFKHCIAWTKYFMKNGYDSLNREIHKGYTEALDEMTEQIYSEIRNQFLSDVFEKENRMFADYGTLRKPRKSGSKKVKITIVLSKKDYEKIRNEATTMHMTLTNYVKEKALEGNVFREDYDFFLEYKGTLDAIERRMRGILTTVEKTGKFLSADMENLQKLCHQVESVHDDAMQIFKARKRKKRTPLN